MQTEALEKVVKIAQKNPKILLSPSYFKKICTRLDMEVDQSKDHMNFSFMGRKAQAAVINAENCGQFKCVVQEGKTGVRIFEFINVLVSLLTDETIPPSPFEKMGPTAEFYCERGIDILQKRFLAGANTTL